MGSDILVVGSFNMDMVMRVKSRSKDGETTFGERFFMGPGGKGANQAYTARTLGASVAIIE